MIITKIIAMLYHNKQLESDAHKKKISNLNN
jgi:hypothetical protein